MGGADGTVPSLSEALGRRPHVGDPGALKPPRAGSHGAKYSVLAPTNARRAALSRTCFGLIARPRVLPLSSAIGCSAARAPSWRGLNGLCTSSHECYHDHENNENAKRDQFSCKHTHLPRRRPAPRQPQRGRISHEGAPNQTSGGARDSSGSARSAFRNAFGCSSEMARTEASATPNQRRPTGKVSGTRLPAPTFIRVTRTAATA